MGKTAFVAWMFVMAAACFVLALGDHSWGWLIGAVVFAGVALLARRLRNHEHDTGAAGPRLGFVGWAMLGMLVAMAGLFWIQFSA